LATLGGLILLVALLSPIFIQAETPLAIIFTVLSVAGIGIATSRYSARNIGCPGQHLACGSGRCLED
jgi:hypothetical protein|tara:strand:- start:8129 stop:8329 length:201 start_codon:yes stop_codon:yes gene_type:complete